LISPWLTAARHSSTIVLGILLLILYPSLAFTCMHAGLNLWSDFVTGLSQASVYTGLLAAGFCAWEAGRWAAPGSTRLRAAVRASALVRLAHAVAIIVPAVAGFAFALTVLAIVGWTTGTYGAPSGPWVVTLAAALVAACSFGYTVGAILGRRWFVPPLAAVLFLSAFVVSRVVPVPHGVRSLYPVVLDADDVFVRHIAPTMWGQSVLFVSVAVLLILLVGGGGRRVLFPRVLAIAALVAASVAGAAMVIATNGQYTTGYNHRDFVCSGSAPEICLNRGYAAALPAMKDRFAELNERSAGTSLTATRLEQNGEGIGDVTSAGARSVYLETVDDPGIGFAVSRYVDKYGGTATCDFDSPDLTSFAAVSIVNTWLSGYDELGFEETDETTPEGAKYARFMQLGVEEGNAWLREHEAAYMACTLTLEDLP
jgi:hypothetical protein